MIMKGKKNNRRDFLKTSSLAASGFFIIPRHVLGRGFIAPSDKLNIAGVGVGGRAETNLPKAFNNGSDNIAALCDVDDRRSVNARAKWPNSPYYKDYRVMLEKEGKKYRRGDDNNTRSYACADSYGRHGTWKTCVC